MQYFGHQVSEKEFHPIKKKVHAIMEASAPRILLNSIFPELLQNISLVKDPHWLWWSKN